MFYVARVLLLRVHCRKALILNIGSSAACRTESAANGIFNHLKRYVYVERSRADT